MSRFTPRLISTDNWNQLVFDFSELGIGRSDDNISQLPDHTTLNDLFYPWHRGMPPEYHLETYMNPRDPSLESTLICQKYSNYTVQRIFRHYSDPSHNLIPHGEFLRTFCERRSQVYEYYEFYLLVMKYFEAMCPIALNGDTLPLMSIQINSQLDSIRSGEVLQRTGNEKRDKKIDSINETSDKINKHKQNILLTRFDWYKTAYESTDGMTYHFWRSEQGKEAIHLIDKKSVSAYERNTKAKNDRARAKKDNRITVPELYGDFKICQCWFCGEFYELPRSKANHYSRHCVDIECQKSNSAWEQKLKYKGESPASLGLKIKKGGKL
jgi:hypothetical protein